ncbi:MAG: PilN domain-containing protein [Endomicrobiales bacterium]
MIKVNLLAPELIKKEERSEILVLGYLLMACLVLTGTTQYFLRVRTYQRLEARLGQSKAELGKYESIVQQVDTLQATKKVLETKKNVIGTLMTGRLTYPVLMEKLLETIPSNVWIKSMTTQMQGDGKMAVTVDAEALDNYSIADFITALSADTDMSAVELGAITSVAASGKAPTSAFRLTFSYMKMKS